MARSAGRFRRKAPRRRADAGCHVPTDLIYKSRRWQQHLLNGNRLTGTWPEGKPREEARQATGGGQRLWPQRTRRGTPPESPKLAGNDGGAWETSPSHSRACQLGGTEAGSHQLLTRGARPRGRGGPHRPNRSRLGKPSRQSNAGRRARRPRAARPQEWGPALPRGEGLAQKRTTGSSGTAALPCFPRERSETPAT